MDYELKIELKLSFFLGLYTNLENGGKSTEKYDMGLPCKQD